MATSVNTTAFRSKYLELFNRLFQFDQNGICHLLKRPERAITQIPFPLYSICLVEEDFLRLFFDEADAQENESVVLTNIEIIPPFTENLCLNLSFSNFVAGVAKTKLTHFNVACFPVQGGDWALLFDNFNDCAYLSRNTTNPSLGSSSKGS